MSASNIRSASASSQQQKDQQPPSLQSLGRTATLPPTSAPAAEEDQGGDQASYDYYGTGGYAAYGAQGGAGDATGGYYGYTDENGNYIVSDGYDQYAAGYGAGYGGYDPESGANPMQAFYPAGGELMPETNWGSASAAGGAAGGAGGGDGNGGAGDVEMAAIMRRGEYAQMAAMMAAAAGGAGVPPLAPSMMAAMMAPLPPAETYGDQDPSLPVEVRKARLERGFEFLRYQPEQRHWLANVCTEMGLSLAFRLYFTYQLYTAFVVFFFMTLDFLFAANYRLWVPPAPGKSAFWQSMAFFVIFFLISFAMVAVLCCVWDMMREFWQTTRTDATLWGFRIHPKDKPRLPWQIFGILIFLTIVLPAVWSLILTASTQRSVVYFAQFFFYISTIITLLIVVVVFIWFWMRSFEQKSRAYKRRLKDEDLPEKKDRIRLREDDEDDGTGLGPAVVNDAATNVSGAVTVTSTNARGGSSRKAGPTTIVNGKKVKSSFYHSEMVLEEYGLDAKSITWSMIAFFFGLIPMFACALVIAIENRDTAMNPGWTAIGVMFFCTFVIIQQFAHGKHRHQSALACMFFISLFIVLGLIGCGSASNGVIFAVYFVALLLSQGMLLRKRNHKLTRKEINRLPHLDVYIDEEEERELQEQLYDSYLCCCKRTMFAAIAPCLEVRTMLGYTHPIVAAEEKAIRKRRICARTDQKFLFVVWLAMSLCMLVVLLIMRSTSTIHTQPQFGTVGGAIQPALPTGELPMCAMRWNTATPAPIPATPAPPVTPAPTLANGTTVSPAPPPLTLAPIQQFTIYDLGILTSIAGYSYSFQYSTDYNAMIGSRFLDVERVHPLSIPGGQSSFLGNRASAQYHEYRDIRSGFTIIVVVGQGVSQNYYRNIDAWGDSIALQLMSVFAPQISTWADQSKADFVGGISFLKKALGGDNFTDAIEARLDAILATTSRSNVIITGHGFNGGIAQLIGQRKGIQSVTFSAPGTRWLSKKYDFDPRNAAGTSVVVQLQTDLLASLDSPEGTGLVQTLRCRDGTSQHACSGINELLREVLRACGDVYGRRPLF